MAKLTKKTYQLCLQTADRAWEVIELWPVFAKSTIGQQLILCLDLLTVSLAKAVQSKQENKLKFINQAREHSIESLVWLDKARRRRLLSKFDYQELYVNLQKLNQDLNF
ncbi:four helix bundle protein [Candidatus Beckwithbacteria bacterium]|nr:four helix bundle protein [Candidatus Beckwithbacteria bacterium]